MPARPKPISTDTASLPGNSMHAANSGRIAAALAIQRAENPQGKCEIYHYNSDGTLDWGYFQINTVHIKRPRINLRDLLDCQANIDFAYQLYREKRGFTPWSTFNNGEYR